MFSRRNLKNIVFDIFLSRAVVRTRRFVKGEYLVIILGYFFLISPQKHRLRVLIRSALARR